MDSRLQVLAKQCKRRGGNCPCTGLCQAACAVDQELASIAIAERELRDRRQQLESLRRRLSSPLATLKADFKFEPGLDPVIVFDGDEASFGYEDANGDWIERNEWPFNEDYVFGDDCERLGFRVE